jgi:hypothetical protein
MKMTINQKFITKEAPKDYRKKQRKNYAPLKSFKKIFPDFHG